MTALTKSRMTVDEFIAWAAGMPGRHELHRGEVYAMSPESAGHAERKGALYLALRNAVSQKSVPCRVLPDGMTVRIDETTAYEPDAIVYCGAKIVGSALEVSNPLVIVEVLSPSTRSVDLSIKLAAYFQLPSVAHYLIVDPEQPSVIHHSRGAVGDIITRVVTEGAIQLDPPGIELTLDQIYAE